MPTYEYLCRSCGDRLEVVQSFTDDPLTVCEACGGELRKVFSAAGLIFKGSGWHIKDYSNSSSGARSTSGTAASSTPSGDGGSGTGSSGAAGGSEGSGGAGGASATSSGSSSGTASSSTD